MIPIAVTQRVDILPDRGERRDALDQRWYDLLDPLDLMPVLMPNHLQVARRLWQSQAPGGVLLTGGNDLAACGGDTPERDASETWLLEQAIEQRLPVLGICRGMQLILHHFGVTLKQIEGHVTPRHPVAMNGEILQVNSYHHWGATDSVGALEVQARAEDGVIEAVRHRTLPVRGIMWHPERETPFSDFDLKLIRSVFHP